MPTPKSILSFILKPCNTCNRKQLWQFQIHPHWEPEDTHKQMPDGIWMQWWIASHNTHENTTTTRFLSLTVSWFSASCPSMVPLEPCSTPSPQWRHTASWSQSSTSRQGGQSCPRTSRRGQEQCAATQTLLQNWSGSGGGVIITVHKVNSQKFLYLYRTRSGSCNSYRWWTEPKVQQSPMRQSKPVL